MCIDSQDVHGQTDFLRAKSYTLGKPADNASLMRKLEWMEKTGMHKYERHYGLS